MRRSWRRWVSVSVWMAALAAASPLPAQVESIGDMPCPIGWLQRKLDPDTSLGPSNFGLDKSVLERCRDSIASDAPGKLADYEKIQRELEETQSAPATRATLRRRLAAVEQLLGLGLGERRRRETESGPPPTRTEPEERSVLETQPLPIARCVELFEKARDDINLALDRGTVYQTPAVTLGRGATAVSFSLASMTFDEVDGAALPAADQVDTWLLTVGAVHGVTDRLDVGIVVPFEELDLPPAPFDPPGTQSGYGDPTVGVQYQVLGRPGIGAKPPADDLSLQLSVTAPAGSSRKLLGTGDWSARLGVVWDRPLPVDFRKKSGSPRLVPYVAAWVVGRERASDPGWGYTAGADVPLPKRTGVFFGFTGEDDGFASYYSDAFLGVRVSRSRQKFWIDGLLTARGGINDAGIRPGDVWLTATVQLTWGGKGSGLVLLP